ncbi:MAG: FAD-binding oxidoreductase [Muribaculaceae bacterium]|nr:FAD-binding oxidoreductase [Muribaculaceae bacterium]
MDSRYSTFLNRISKTIDSKRIYTNSVYTLAWGTDAGFYRLIPKIVVKAENEEQVSMMLSEAHSLGLPVTFRAAGTSLSGQAISDSILIVAGKDWENYSVADDATTITMQPGIVGARVNDILKPYGKIFSPDPASKNSAMVGGIIINNASGMNCGTHANSDREIVSARIILADGTILDTGNEESKVRFSKTHSEFIERIKALRDKVRANEALSQRIRFKYSIKNVTGLNILPFIIYDDPFDIITHLLVGSEGTLAFLSEVTMKTEHLYPYSASAMLYFSNIREACNAVIALKKCGKVHSAELLDKKSLSSVNDTTGEGLTAILTETKADSKAELQDNIAIINSVLSEFNLFKPANFTDDPAEYSQYWAMRSGIFPSVGGTRRPGTTVLIEDVAFHIENLPDATADLQEMLERHGYDDACIYGHVLEGNYHFIIAQAFDTQKDIDQYRNLMKEVEHLVVDKYDGSLKAEHGTGRNMAPFVEKEWGAEAFAIMREVKDIFDSKNILNPGVIFNDDPDCYIKNIKPLPLANPIIDKCIECGFCEVNCTSCGFTLSSRQRIVIAREIARLKSTGEDPKRLETLEREFQYPGNVMCAGDGLCSTSCPMKINTGDLIHAIRESQFPPKSFGYKIGSYAANNLPTVKLGLRMMLSTASFAHNVIGDNATDKIGHTLHKLGLPLWTHALPKAYYHHKIDNISGARKVVYFPSCINQTMGAGHKPKSQVSLIDTVVELFNKAGYEVISPKNMNSLCCGLTWESKGMPDIANRKSEQLEKALIEASNNGEYPVVCDQSPCMHRMKHVIKGVKLYELLEFIHDYAVPYLKFTPTEESVALHITCSSKKMNLTHKITDLAKMCSTRVLVPEGIGCCGFAGDKGFTHPELNEWSLRKLRSQVKTAQSNRGFSNSRTCEIGLTTNSGIPYQSLVYLINECTEPKK